MSSSIVASHTCETQNNFPSFNRIIQWLVWPNHFIHRLLSLSSMIVNSRPWVSSQQLLACSENGQRFSFLPFSRLIQNCVITFNLTIYANWYVVSFAKVFFAHFTIVWRLYSCYYNVVTDVCWAWEREKKGNTISENLVLNSKRSIVLCCCCFGFKKGSSSANFQLLMR